MKSKSNIREIVQFLSELQQHNDRAWFKARKERFDALRQPWEQDIERLIALVSEFDPGTRGLDVKGAVYRIYRDIRFSPDKRPYKDWFGAVIGRGGRHTRQSCNYVHFQPGNLMLCGGIWWPEKPILDRLRSLIDAESEEFLEIINNPEITSRYHWECDALKTVPKGYDRNHPMAEYLRMKEYIMVKKVDLDYFDCDDWVARMADDLRPLQPLHDFLNYAVE